MSLIFSEGGVGGVTEEELQAAVDALQDQIDTISAASDVTDIVGTYTDLQNYDTSSLSDKAIIKVLNDSTHNGTPSYYRWSTVTDTFTYIGSESRVNDGTLTILQGSTTLGTFSANSATNESINIPETSVDAVSPLVYDNYIRKPENATLTANNTKFYLNKNGLAYDGYFGSNGYQQTTFTLTIPTDANGKLDKSKVALYKSATNFIDNNYTGNNSIYTFINKGDADMDRFCESPIFGFLDADGVFHPKFIGAKTSLNEYPRGICIYGNPTSSTYSSGTGCTQYTWTRDTNAKFVQSDNIVNGTIYKACWAVETIAANMPRMRLYTYESGSTTNKQSSVDFSTISGDFSCNAIIFGIGESAPTSTYPAYVANYGVCDSFSLSPTITTPLIIVSDGKTLQLEIGNGLDVQDNKLVNTTDLSNYYTKSETDALIPTDVSDLTNTTLADKNLSNLSATGENRLHALKGYEDAGELLTDAEGLADVKSYAHSTFDSSKFTVVGSPVVTNEGIASGFSSNTNYILWQGDTGTYSKFVIKGRQKVTTDGGYLFWCNGSQFLITYGTNSGGIYLDIFIDNANVSSILNNQIGSPTNNSWIEYEAGYIATGVFVNITYNGTTYPFTFSSTPTLTAITKIGIGGSYSGGGQNANTEIDLKYTAIELDNIPVFSGNKTGIDTIKPDDYTVVGALTISADGIASGFSDTTNYIKTAVFSPGTKTWKIYRGFTTSTVGTTQRISSSKSFGINLSINSNNHFSLQLSSNGTTNDIGSIVSTYTVQPYTHYVLCVEFTGTEYKLSYSTDGITFINDGSLASTATVGDGASDGGKLGTNNWYVDTEFLGSIDLNECLDYIGGDLVYQPCLKIPYTLSKTGSKVVDSAYRDRVSDMYGQFGYAPYYTLSESDFTLPQGEVYGLIGQRTLRDSYRNGINYWELYSDRMLEQGGVCESGTTVNLLKPFADTNYILTVPYSAKTTTSFTPSATGDYIAKGIGEL